MSNARRPLRRDFLKTTALASAAALAGGLADGMMNHTLFGAENEPASQDAPARRLRLLILGGTGFIGPWMAELAVARGHDVTLFNRGRRERFQGSADGTEKLYGNRDPDRYAQSKVVDGKEVDDETSPKGLSELEGKQWDAVIDNSGYVPRIVAASAKLLAPNVGQYLFISTLSVYADNSKPGLDESDRLATMSDPTSENVSAHYGPLKVLCEQAVEAAIPDRFTIVRPGFIVGPRDTTDRFTYWAIRVHEGGEVLVPGNPDDPVQFIDVRDLADFTLRCLENQILGIYNVTGPRERTTVSEVMNACVAASKSEGGAAAASLTYVPYEWLAENGASSGRMPILLPSTGRTAGFHQRSSAKAVAAGLKHRPVEETCRSLLQWWPEEVAKRKEVAKEMNEDRVARGLAPTGQAVSDLPRAGISRDKEADLLAKWQAQKGK